MKPNIMIIIPDLDSENPFAQNEIAKEVFDTTESHEKYYAAGEKIAVLSNGITYYAPVSGIYRVEGAQKK